MGGAGDERLPAERVKSDSRKINIARFNSANVPRPRAHWKGDGRAACVELARGSLIHTEIGAVAEADIAAVYLG